MKKIAFVGSKGGIGTTFVTTNTAVLLAARAKQPVLVVDLNLDRADVATALNATPRIDLGKYFEQLNSTEPFPFSSFVHPVEGYKQLYLASSDVLPQRSVIQITPDMMITLVSELSGLDPLPGYVLFEGLEHLTPAAAQLLELVDQVFFLLSPEVSALNALQSKLNVLKHMYFAPQKVRLLLNHLHASALLPTDEIIKALDPFILLYQIPYGDEKVLESLEMGTPLVLEDKGNPAARAVSTLVDYLLDKVSEDELVRKVQSGGKKGFGFLGFGKKDRGGRRPRRSKPRASTPSPAGEEDLTALLDEVMELTEQEQQGDTGGSTTLEEALGVGAQAPAAPTPRATDGKHIPLYRVSVERDEQWNHWKSNIHRALLTKINWREFGQVQQNSEAGRELRRKVESIVLELMDHLHVEILDKEKRQQFVQEVLDEALGYGPLEVLLRDPSISEIMVNGKDQIYIERGGKIYLTDVTFLSDDQLRVIIDRILAPLGKRVDDSMPYADARLPDGSRVNVIIPPLALTGPTITIRKFSQKKLTAEELIQFGSITREMVEFLRATVYVRKNILISGGTGTGKTTFLNMLSGFIPEDERIITVEDTAELQLQQAHVVRLESRPPNVEGKGEVTIRDLVRNCLRMRPDRIVVGECRGAEALDMLQAMNTGHDGSLTTIHANSPRDALSRLETMVLMAGTELPSKAIRQQITSAVQIIVQLSRFRDGTRKVVAISEITGMEGDIITMQDIFVYRQTGVDPETGKVLGFHTATGVRPSFYDELEASGVKLPPDLFHPKAEMNQNIFG